MRNIILRDIVPEQIVFERFHPLHYSSLFFIIAPTSGLPNKCAKTYTSRPPHLYKCGGSSKSSFREPFSLSTPKKFVGLIEDVAVAQGVRTSINAMDGLRK